MFFPPNPYNEGEASGDDDEEDEEDDVGGGTDDEVPPSGGENYFGRAAKEGAAPVGANPFAAPPPSAQFDMASEIAGEEEKEGFSRNFRTKKKLVCYFRFNK